MDQNATAFPFCTAWIGFFRAGEAMMQTQAQMLQDCDHLWGQWFQQHRNQIENLSRSVAETWGKAAVTVQERTFTAATDQHQTGDAAQHHQPRAAAQ